MSHGHDYGELEARIIAALAANNQDAYHEIFRGLIKQVEFDGSRLHDEITIVHEAPKRISARDLTEAIEMKLDQEVRTFKQFVMAQAASFGDTPVRRKTKADRRRVKRKAQRAARRANR